MSARCCAALAIATLAACAAAPSYTANPQLLSLAEFVVYQGSQGPLSYQAATGRDVDRLISRPRARARACQRGLQLPVLAVIGALWSEHPSRTAPGALSFGWGDGSYQAASSQLRSKLPAHAQLYDVRVDLQQRAILGMYLEQCVVIDAGVVLPRSEAPL